MYDYLIYDFDGTISDSYPIFAESLMIMLERHGIPADYETVYKQLKISVGHALRSYDWGLTHKEAVKEYYNIDFALAREKQQAFPEAEEILRYAKERGVKNYIYTHTQKIVYELLEKMGLIDYFDFILDGSYDFPRKPAPDALNYLCEKCGIDKSRALMIGDRDIDILAGAAAGVRGCLFDPDGYYTDFKSADHYINNLLELKEII